MRSPAGVIKVNSTTPSAQRFSSSEPLNCEHLRSCSICFPAWVTVLPDPSPLLLLEGQAGTQPRLGLCLSFL
eukprot:scaffold81359_cov17-Tisochrysis_lutea.AAC.1